MSQTMQKAPSVFESRSTQRSKLRMRKMSNALSSDRGAVTFRDDDYLSKGCSTVSFSYALAVEKALRRQYQVPLFGPPSAAPRRDRASAQVEVTRLPDIYRDFRYLNSLVDRNREFSERLRVEAPLLESAYTVSDEQSDGVTRLPKIRSRKRSRENSLSQSNATKGRSDSFTKLPPIKNSR